MNDLISIIVPMYNVEPYIEKCILSITSQSYIYLDIILVNDGSTDNTLSICNSYAIRDKRIRVLNQENRGVSSARNLGLKNIRGKYFLFVDADDFIGINHVKKLYEFILKDNSDICIGSYTEIISGRYDIPEYKGKDFYHRLNNKEATMKMAFHDGFGGEPVSKLFSSYLITDNDILFDFKQKVGEDFMFCCLIFKYAKSICYCNEASYFYQRRDGSATRSSVFNSLNRIRSAKQYEKFILENYKELDASIFYYYSFCYLEVINSILENKSVEKCGRLLEILKFRIFQRVPKVIFLSHIPHAFKVKMFLASISIRLYANFRKIYLKIKSR